MLSVKVVSTKIENPELRNLPAGTIVKFPNNMAYFVVPTSNDLPNVWLCDDGTCHGGVTIFRDSTHYRRTDYTIIGKLDIKHNKN